MLDIPKTKMVVPSKDDSEYKLLRLRFEKESELSLLDMLEVILIRLDEVPDEALKMIREETGGLVPDSLVLDYDHWQSCMSRLRSSDDKISDWIAEILAAVLPVEQIDDVPSGFTTTGHIGEFTLGRTSARIRLII